MKVLTVNLEQKLISEKKKQIELRKAEIRLEQNIINQANSILSESTESVINTLNNAGFGTAIQNANSVVSANLKKKSKLETLKNERIFTVDEIKTLALNYGLRFLPTSFYKGDIPSDLAGKIKEVEDIYGKPEPEKVGSYPLPRSLWSRGGEGFNHNYMILAPASSFELQERPKDPLLFRRLPDGSFYLVHKWGSDLSSIRFISYSFKRSRWPHAIIGLVAYLTFLPMFQSAEIKAGFTFIYFIAAVFAIGFPGISWSIDEYKSSWNSSFKS
jgi:hypothetical protein